MRSRIAFETDAMNNYFTRMHYPGEYTLRPLNGTLQSAPIPDHALNLSNGVATLNLSLPPTTRVGDTFEYELVISDSTLVEPFMNRFAVSVGPAQRSGGGQGNRRQHANSGEW